VNKAQAEQMVRAKDFTMVQAFTSNPYVCHRFVALTPSLPVARKLAAAYVKAQGWKDAKLHYYPRTYVRDCVKLVAEGKYVSGKANVTVDIELGGD
jgi:hypothetical protein